MCTVTGHAVAGMRGTLQVTATTVAPARPITETVTAGRPSEFHFTLSKKALTRGTVTFKVTNKGSLPHDFKVAGKKTRPLAPASRRR
jgi:uncharacterized cupredoxin-like copper-binding protein